MEKTIHTRGEALASSFFVATVSNLHVSPTPIHALAASHRALTLFLLQARLQCLSEKQKDKQATSTKTESVRGAEITVGKKGGKVTYTNSEAEQCRQENRQRKPEQKRTKREGGKIDAAATWSEQANSMSTSELF